MAVEDNEADDGRDSEIDVGDIEAYARKQLAEGEQILGEGVEADQVADRGVNNTGQILDAIKAIEYKVPEGAKRVPWVDTMVIEGQTEIKGVGPKDGVKLESTFLTIGRDAVREAYRRLRVMKIPCTRPSDFMAEMLRTDKQMFKVRQRAAEELKRIKIVEDRKKHLAGKKFEKKAKSKKLQLRAEEKKQTQQDIQSWKKARKEDKVTDDQDLSSVISRQQQGKKGKEWKKGSGHPVKSKKRQAADEKYGFGGPTRRKKQNDSASFNDDSNAPWNAGGDKGKGKGKGKGGKGKGKGSGGAKKGVKNGKMVKKKGKR